MKFEDKLDLACKRNNSLLCVGLDSELEKLPKCASSQLEFNKAIIDATKDLVCAYKPNMAFYEAYGVEGLKALHATIRYIPDHIPVILDAKRGDIGNTSRLYAKACFEGLRADAVTLHGYMGEDTVEPFLRLEWQAIFVLVKTSNKSSGEFQDIEGVDGKKLYIRVAEKVAEWNERYSGTAGAVVGATYPEELKQVRDVLGDAPILIPGLGAQGGDVEKTIRYGTNKRGLRAVVNSSRGIIFASKGNDFAEKAREAAEAMREQVNACRDM